MKRATENMTPTFQSHPSKGSQSEGVHVRGGGERAFHYTLANEPPVVWRKFLRGTPACVPPVPTPRGYPANYDTTPHARPWSGAGNGSLTAQWPAQLGLEPNRLGNRLVKAHAHGLPRPCQTWGPQGRARPRDARYRPPQAAARPSRRARAPRPWQGGLRPGCG